MAGLAAAIRSIDPRLTHLKNLYAPKDETVIRKMKHLVLISILVCSAAMTIFASPTFATLGFIVFVLSLFATRKLGPSEETIKAEKVSGILATPGYFEWALEDARQLSSADGILHSYSDFGAAVRSTN